MCVSHSNAGVYEYKEMLEDAVKPKIEDINAASDEEFKELLGELQKQKDQEKYQNHGSMEYLFKEYFLKLV